MEFDHRSKGNSKSKGKSNGRGKCKGKRKDKSETRHTRQSVTCAERKSISRETWSRANQFRIVSEVEGAKVDSDAAKEFVFANENVVKDVSLSQSGFEVHEEGLVMIEASVHVCPKWLG